MESALENWSYTCLRFIKELFYNKHAIGVRVRANLVEVPKGAKAIPKKKLPPPKKKTSFPGINTHVSKTDSEIPRIALRRSYKGSRTTPMVRKRLSNL